MGCHLKKNGYRTIILNFLHFRSRLSTCKEVNAITPILGQYLLKFIARTRLLLLKAIDAHIEFI